ncbi:hypothetical protein YT1_p10066 (plasmid) [Rhodococcus ruber]|nr:hypothetical protein YT1_p10066 [Rhodococcus ruber]
MNQQVGSAIMSINEAAWVPIRYPNAIYDDQEQRTPRSLKPRSPSSLPAGRKSI